MAMLMWAYDASSCCAWLSWLWQYDTAGAVEPAAAASVPRLKAAKAQEASEPARYLHAAVEAAAAAAAVHAAYCSSIHPARSVLELVCGSNHLAALRAGCQASGAAMRAVIEAVVDAAWLAIDCRNERIRREIWGARQKGVHSPDMHLEPIPA